MQSSNERYYTSSFTIKFFFKKKVTSIKGMAICNTAAPNPRNKNIYVIVIYQEKALSCSVSNFFKSVKALLKKTFRHF